jgi:hypothetical protein
MTVGFSVIGIAHSYELITLGEYYFLSYIIKGFAPRLTIFFLRSVDLCWRSGISNGYTKRLNVHDQKPK